MIKVQDHGNLKGFSSPRSIVRLDGHDTYFSNWSVNLNSAHEADDFSIVFPFHIDRNTQQAYLVNSPDFASYLFTKSDILVEVFVGFPPNALNYSVNDLTRIMYGYMDEVDFEGGGDGEKVTVTGRNMVARMIDNKVTDKFQNMTSSAVAAMIAKTRGMKIKATPTYSLVGSYFNGDSVQVATNVTEWDLLTYLAEQEGFEMRVKDDTLYFGPYNEVVGNLINTPLEYTWGQNIMDLKITRSPHAAKNIVVQVHSYDPSGGAHIQGIAKRAFKGSSDPLTQRYYFTGLTQQVAQLKAKSILDQLSRMEMVGTMTVAGNELITVDRKISLFGVGSGFSQPYYVGQVSHTFDPTSDGYGCEVSFSNLLLQGAQ